MESVLGATPREFESRILRHVDQGRHQAAVPAGWRFEARWSHLLVSVWAPSITHTGIRGNCLARSRASLTALNREQHAAEACALPFRAGRDRSPPAGYQPTTYRITVSDREVLRARAPTRLITGGKQTFDRIYSTATERGLSARTTSLADVRPGSPPCQQGGRSRLVSVRRSSPRSCRVRLTAAAGRRRRDAAGTGSCGRRCQLSSAGPCLTWMIFVTARLRASL